VAFDWFIAIDIVVAGPPCVDYSKANSRRQGTAGSQGMYLVKTAELVNKIQNHELQKGRKLFFLIENVVLDEDEADQVCQGLNGLQKSPQKRSAQLHRDEKDAEKALEIDWRITLDSEYISPTYRNVSLLPHAVTACPIVTQFGPSCPVNGSCNRELISQIFPCNYQRIFMV
jgi:C-5 cytosine-specific DNA methylase